MATGNTRQLFPEFVEKVYDILDFEKEKTVDQICNELGTEDDFAVLSAISYLDWRMKARRGKSKIVYDKHGYPFFLSTYRKYVPPSPVRKVSPEFRKKVYDALPTFDEEPITKDKVCEMLGDEDPLDVLAALAYLGNERRLAYRDVGEVCLEDGTRLEAWKFSSFASRGNKL